MCLGTAKNISKQPLLKKSSNMSYFYAKMTIVMVHFILDKNIFTYEMRLFELFSKHSDNLLTTKNRKVTLFAVVLYIHHTFIGGSFRAHIGKQRNKSSRENLQCEGYILDLGANSWLGGW